MIKVDSNVGSSCFIPGLRGVMAVSWLLAAVLCYVTSARRSIVIDCNRSCEPMLRNSQCDVIKGENDVNNGSVPMPRPHFTKCGWYKAEVGGRGVVALDISWEQRGRRVGLPTHRGFNIEILRSQSLITTALLFKLKHSKSKLRNHEMVRMNYHCHGLAEEELLSPGHNYHLILRSLPNNYEITESLYDSCQVTLPDCDNEEMEGTTNCDDDYTDYVESSTTTLATTTSTRAPVVHACCGQAFMTYILVVVLVGFLLILSLYMATKACSRNKATMDRAKSLLLVMSSVESDPMLARLLDRLAGSLGALGFDVDSTIWRRTEITPVGAARWIHEQVGSYDHVIICMGLDGGMQEGTCDVTDPFPVVLDLAQHGNLKNYSVVSFKRRNKFWSFLFLPRIFEIPDEFYDLAKNISTNLNLKEMIRVKKMLKKELAEIIGNY